MSFNGKPKASAIRNAVAFGLPLNEFGRLGGILMKRLFLFSAPALALGAGLLLNRLDSAAMVNPVALAADQPAAKGLPAGDAAHKSAVPPAERPAYASVRIAAVPHVKQKPDFCGEACAAMYLTKLGYRINQDDVFDQGGVDPELGRGCHTRELSRALTRIGFQPGTVWFSVQAARAAAELKTHFRALHADLMAGVPNIVCMRYDESPDATEHFRLILGYDNKTDEVLYHEPAVADSV